MTATTTNYFDGLTDSQGISNLFIKLSRDFSPAMVELDPAFSGADAATKQAEKVRRQLLTLELNTQFQSKVLEVVPGEMIARKQARLDLDGAGKTVDDSYKNWAATTGISGYGPLTTALNAVIHLTHCRIEIIGCWLYIREFTAADEPVLNRAGFRKGRDTDEIGNTVEVYRWAGSKPRQHVKGIDAKKRLFGSSTVNDPNGRAA
jgi:hypothetical protein